jgi:regulator of sirC expression with transglutaminase-like and TPR domain
MFFMRLRRQAKWVFVFLALVFAASFVLFGVGTGFGGLESILKRNGGSSSTSSISKAQDDVDKNPRNAAAYKALAQAYQSNGDNSSAISTWERYVKLRPRDTEALGQLDTLYLDRLAAAQNRYNAAQQQSADSTFPQLVQLQLGKKPLPTDPITSAQVSETDQAIGAAQTAVQLAAAKALATGQRLAGLQPNDPNVQLQLGQVAIAAQDVPVAIKAYKRFLKIAPQSTNAPLVRRYVKQLEQFSASRGGG